MSPHGDGPRNHPALRDLNLPALGGHVGMHGGGPLVTKTLLVVNSGGRYFSTETDASKTIIPGHADDPHRWSDLVDYSGFYNDLLSKAQEGKAAGRSVADVVGAYTVPDQYSEFQASANRLEATVQHIFDGR